MREKKFKQFVIKLLKNVIDLKYSENKYIRKHTHAKSCEITLIFILNEYFQDQELKQWHSKSSSCILIKAK